MFLYNDFRHDSRVLKEGRSLVAAGYDVTVIALRAPDLPNEEERDGIHVIRVERNPLHIRAIHRIASAKQFAAFPSKLVRAWRTRRVRNASRHVTKREVGTAAEAPSLLSQHVSDDETPPQPRGVRRALHFLLRKILFLFHSPLCYFDFYRRSRPVAHRLRPAICHAHDLNTLPAAFLVARQVGARLVYDSHELYLDRNRPVAYGPIRRWATRTIERFLIRRTDAVITVNQAIAEVLARRYAIPTPTVVMNVPIRSQAIGRSPLRDHAGVENGRRILLYTGSITFNRGLDKVIRSLPLLPDCHLVLLGYGAEHFIHGLRDTAADAGVAERMTVLPPVPSDHVVTWAAGADIGLAPIENASLSYYYCSPNKLFEYILAGIPVAASDFPELRRAIDAYDAGATFDPTDPSDIARAVRWILDTSPPIRPHAMAARGALGWDREEIRLLDLYRGLEVLARRTVQRQPETHLSPSSGAH